LLVTPEYNYSIPDVFKNAVDWLSRPASDLQRVFGGKPVALMGATPGRGGTDLAHAAWLSVLRSLGTVVWSGSSVYAAGASKLFDAEGRLVDAAIRTAVQKHIEGFAAFIARLSRPT
jgi:chromate reductase